MKRLLILLILLTGCEPYQATAVTWGPQPVWVTVNTIPGQVYNALVNFADADHGDGSTNVYVYAPVGTTVHQTYPGGDIPLTVGTSGMVTFVQGPGSSFDPNSSDPAHRVGPLSFWCAGGLSATVEGVGLRLNRHEQYRIIFTKNQPPVTPTAMATPTATATAQPSPTPTRTPAPCNWVFAGMTQLGDTMTITLKCR